MKKNLQWKLATIIAVIGLCLFLVYPPEDKIKLGLDLKGGTHLVLQVLTEDAINVETDQQLSRFQEVSRKIISPSWKPTKKNRTGFISGESRLTRKEKSGTSSTSTPGTGIILSAATG